MALRFTGLVSTAQHFRERILAGIAPEAREAFLASVRDAVVLNADLNESEEAEAALRREAEKVWSARWSMYSGGAPLYVCDLANKADPVRQNMLQCIERRNR